MHATGAAATPIDVHAPLDAAVSATAAQSIRGAFEDTRRSLQEKTISSIVDVVALLRVPNADVVSLLTRAASGGNA
jgi:hypothetical protein